LFLSALVTHRRANTVDTGFIERELNLTEALALHDLASVRLS
jgi:hypothetical protein